MSNNKERNIKCVEYWMKKGFNENVSIEKSNRAKKEGNIYNIEYWMKKGFNKNESIEKIEQIKKENSKYNIEYWMKRGYEKIDAVKEIEKTRKKKKENIKENHIYFIEYWIKKGLSEKDAIVKIEKLKKENSHWNINFWIKRGLSKKEAIKKISKIQKENNNKSLLVEKKSPYKIEYWLEKGFSEKDSQIKIKETKNNSNPYNILSKEKIDSMINNRKTTFYSKTTEEINKINKSKGLNKEDFIKKHGIENYLIVYNKRRMPKEKYIIKYGLEKWNEKILNLKKSLKNRKFIKHSKISLELFESIDLKEAFFGKHEKCISIKKNDLNHVYYVDFIYENKIIEFYGDYWHGNPNLYSETDIIGSKYKHNEVKEKWEQDKFRENLLKDEGYELLIIWEQDYKKNKKQIIELCKKWIKK